MSRAKGDRRVRRYSHGQGRRRTLVQSVAMERIQILLGLAESMARRRENRLARRYVELAKKISMRTKVSIQKDRKWFLCKGCLLPLLPGLNARVRLSPERKSVTITCLECQHVGRHPYAREKRMKRKTVNPYITRTPAVKELQLKQDLAG